MLPISDLFENSLKINITKDEIKGLTTVINQAYTTSTLGPIIRKAIQEDKQLHPEEYLEILQAARSPRNKRILIYYVVSVIGRLHDLEYEENEKHYRDTLKNYKDSFKNKITEIEAKILNIEDRLFKAGPGRVGDSGPSRVGDSGPSRVGDSGPSRVGDSGSSVRVS